MSQTQTKTIKMVYHGKLEHISCPLDAKYDDILGIAVERFGIPDEFRTSLQISNALTQVFEKDSFDNITTLLPNTETIFYIRVNYEALLGELESTSILKSNKRKRETYVAVPVTRQNCFIGSFPGFDPSDPEEPPAKRRKANEKPIKIKPKTTECRKAYLRKLIRF